MSAVSGGETQGAAVAPGVKPPLALPRRLLRMRSDAALAERFAAGDEAAFDVIYERHRAVVLAVSIGVLGTTQDAEDATQETFSALAVALRTKPPAELRPWLIRVSRNASIDTIRRRRHRLLTLDGEIPDTPARPAGAGQAELAVVLDGIRELPEGQRMALLMRELGGHTYAEIAEFLETDEDAVKGLIARARVGLRTYREATELPCASARATISAEPDGRRYDKTIRRHLRTCASCRAYRSALRDDAKTLRAALPLPAGGVATGGISTGALAAAKGAAVGYGLTQAAATCAASACAVGAIGGMVFITPVHRFGIPTILPPAKAAPAHKHAAVKVTPKHTVVVRAAPAETPTVGTAAVSAAPVATRHVVAATTKRDAHAGVAHRARHAPSSTRVNLPATLRASTPAASPAATTLAQSPTLPPAPAPAPASTSAQVPTQPQTPITSTASGHQPPAIDSRRGHGHAQAQAASPAASRTATPASQASTASQPAATKTAASQSTGGSTSPRGGHGSGQGRGSSSSHRTVQPAPTVAARTTSTQTTTSTSGYVQPPAYGWGANPTGSTPSGWDGGYRSWKR